MYSLRIAEYFVEFSLTLAMPYSRALVLLTLTLSSDALWSVFGHITNFARYAEVSPSCPHA